MEKLSLHISQIIESIDFDLFVLILNLPLHVVTPLGLVML